MIAVADRAPVFLHGVMGVLVAEGYEVFGVSTVGEARDLVDKAPDAAVIDVRILAADSEILHRARAGGIPVVVTVSQADARGAVEFVSAGVSGLWDRDGEIAELRRVVTGALSGAPVVSAEIGAALLERLGGTAQGGRLTAREREILDHMAAGDGNRAIADALFISENTVRNHVRNVLDKLQARSRTEAVVRAARAGLVRLG